MSVECRGSSGVPYGELEACVDLSSEIVLASALESLVKWGILDLKCSAMAALERYKGKRESRSSTRDEMMALRAAYWWARENVLAKSLRAASSRQRSGGLIATSGIRERALSSGDFSRPIFLDVSRPDISRRYLPADSSRRLLPAK
jgi:hypothetical protein